MYTDDTNLLSTICRFQCPASSDSSLTNNINKELIKVSDWLAVNKLSLNVNKTKYMIFHPRQKNLLPAQIPQIMINNKPIEKVENFKFLGVIIDQNLSWNIHINHIANKLSRVCGILTKLKNMLPKNILRMIYCTLFLSHLNYGITAWGFHSCTRIIMLQKKVIRLISNNKFNAHTSPIFKELGLLKFKDIFNLSCIKFYFKYKNNMLPTYFNNMFTPNEPILHTRPHRTVRTPRKYEETVNNIPILTPTMPITHTNTKTSRLCIRHHIPTLINEKKLPQIVMSKIETHSCKGFNHYAKQYIINEYNSTCNIARCHACTS